MPRYHKNISRGLPWILAGLISFSVPIVYAKDGASGPVYSFGIVPQFSASRINKTWKPILDQISKRTGVRFRMQGSASIPFFEKQFMSGEFDFAYMNPYHILLANKAGGYRPLVRDVGRRLHGIIVVRKDSPVKHVRDLNGRVVAFPAPNALGASLMPRAAFHNRYKINVYPRYVKSHSSVYLNVALGQAAGGGGVQKTLSQQPADVRDALRVIYTTEKVAPHPVAAHSRVPRAIRDKVRKAFLELGATPEGKALLAKVPMKRIGPASMGDYIPLKKLGLDPFYKKD